MSDTVPAQFRFDFPMLKCERDRCDWSKHVDGDPLTEIVAVAREHVEEAHRG